jgi:hypothetical protein
MYHGKLDKKLQQRKTKFKQQITSKVSTKSFYLNKNKLIPLYNNQAKKGR